MINLRPLVSKRNPTGPLLIINQVYPGRTSLNHLILIINPTSPGSSKENQLTSLLQDMKINLLLYSKIWKSTYSSTPRYENQPSSLLLVELIKINLPIWSFKIVYCSFSCLLNEILFINGLSNGIAFIASLNKRVGPISSDEKSFEPFKLIFSLFKIFHLGFKFRNSERPPASNFLV